MVSITLKNIPEVLHQELKQRARLHHRSLNKELLATIELAITGTPISQEVKLGSGRGLLANYPLDDSLVTMNFGNEWEINS